MYTLIFLFFLIFFLVGAVFMYFKYRRIYKAMNDLSANLDKRVDEKTIEYNELINKQKDFISIISHEIKSPLASAIFQSDSIIEDLEKEKLSWEALLSEQKLLHEQIIRTSSILTKLFSVEYSDRREVHLFREDIFFPGFLEHEIELFSRGHPNVRFISEISKDMEFFSIDKIQFQQVLTNLLDNAVKFTKKQSNPTISLSGKMHGKKWEITIEDNGKWFLGIKTKDIFDKYATGNHGTIGLWMWLYLCKKIIALHGGTITAGRSEKYKWAKFTIRIPKK